MIRLREKSTYYILFYFILLSFSKNIYAQNTDSLFNAFVNSFNNTRYLKQPAIIESNHIHDKCAFGITAQIYESFNSFTTSQQSILKQMMDRRDNLHTSSVSPSGFFRIHYDTVGTNAPRYFTDSSLTSSQIVKMSVDSLAAALDSSYNYEVNILGYGAPPLDNGEGGDELYDVYVSNINYYGYVNPLASYVPTHMNIHNSFEGFYASGIKGAKVTAAHEFHHSIQLANYGWHGDSETYFYEMTSTAMEEFVYDDINEYYRDMSFFFRTPDQSIVGDSNRGYEDAVFLVYLHERFMRDESDFVKGFNIIKKSWEEFENTGNAIGSIAYALFNEGTSLKHELNNFGVWCYFTSSRAVPGKYFYEAADYPLLKPFASYEFNSPLKQYTISTQPVSNNYLVFILTDQGFRDSLVTVLTNSDIDGSISPFTNSLDVSYILTTNDDQGANHVINNYFTSLVSSTSSFLSESYIFNNEVVSNQMIVRETPGFAFPQPFLYSIYDELYFPAEPNTLEYAHLNIYTISMNLVYSGKARIFTGEKIVVKWNAKDNKGDKLPNGVYIYAVKSGDKLTKGKFVVYND